MYYVAVTGYRSLPSPIYVIDRLDEIRYEVGIDMMVIHGDCPHQDEGYSADALTKEWAIDNAIPYLSIPAMWKTLGNGAGPQRNKRYAKWLSDILKMSSRGIDDDKYICLAFTHPNARGTLGCIKEFQRYGLTNIERIDQDGNRERDVR